MTKSNARVPGIPAERMRSLVQGPDGALYVVTDAGEVWKLSVRPGP